MSRCWCGGLAEGDVCLASKFHDPHKKPEKREPNRLYLAGPMSGYEDSNYPAFNSAAALMRSHGYVVENPAEIGDLGSHYTDLLKEDIRIILDCDGVAVMEGWWMSTGARLEVNVAGIIGLPVRPVQEWVARRQMTDASHTLETNHTLG